MFTTRPPFGAVRRESDPDRGPPSRKDALDADDSCSSPPRPVSRPSPSWRPPSEAPPRTSTNLRRNTCCCSPSTASTSPIWRGTSSTIPIRPSEAPPRTSTNLRPTRAADLGRRPAPVRPRLVRRAPSRTRRWRRSTRSGVEYTQRADARSRRTRSRAWSAQVTGGNPKTTGVYYDDTYNHALLPGRHDGVRAARRRAPR